MIDLENASIDAYFDGLLYITQPNGSLKAGLDSLLLAASLSLRPDQKILDLGCGCFQLGLFLLARQADVCVTGVENQLKLVNFAHHNINSANQWSQCQVIQADIIADDLKNIRSNFFDHVISNPPYFSFGPATQLKKDQEVRANARKFSNQHTYATLYTWLSVAKKKLKQGGMITMSLCDRQLPSALKVLKELDFGGIEVLPLFPTSDKPATRFLLAAKKDSKSLDHTYGGLTLRDHKRAIRPEISRLAKKPHGVSWLNL
ncbi:MAG: methyltransferase [Alphaproteobacteria bacterium]